MGTFEHIILERYAKLTTVQLTINNENMGNFWQKCLRLFQTDTSNTKLYQTEIKISSTRPLINLLKLFETERSIQELVEI